MNFLFQAKPLWPVRGVTKPLVLTQFYSPIVCGRVPWLYQYWPGGFMVFVVLCPGTPEGSTGSGSGFKASQKTGQRLKISSDRLGEAGNRTSTPGLQDIGLSPTPRRLLSIQFYSPV